MTEFLNMWKNYANFSARTTVRGYWMAYLFVVISAIVFSVISIAIGSIVFMILYIIYTLALFIPSLAMSVRRLRDAGKEWTYLFISLIPFVGVILLIIALVQPSVPENGVPTV